MNPFSRLHVALAILTLAVASPSFAADNSAEAMRTELDPNGVLYTHIDFEGGWRKVAQDLQTALKGTAAGKKDLAAVSEILGLSQIQAIGLSSTVLPQGYDNRLFLSTPGGRNGLLKIFPGEPKTFTGAKFAPADADLFLEMHLDVPAIWGTLLQAATLLVEPADVGHLLESIQKSPFGAGQLLKFQGRLLLTLRMHSVDPTAEEKANLEAMLPDTFFQLENGGQAIATELAKNDQFVKQVSGARTYFRGQGKILLIVEGDQLSGGMPATFVEECLHRTAGLDKSAAFASALAATASQGQAVTYATPHFIESFRELITSFGLPANDLGGEMGALDHRTQVARQILEFLPTPKEPVVSVIVARPEGVLIRERSVVSSKLSLPVVALLTPDVVGPLAVMMARSYALTALEDQQTREMQTKIEGELDALEPHARDYFTTHKDETKVKLSTLLETYPDKKLPDFSAFTAQDFEFDRNSDKLEVELTNGRTITHVFVLTSAQREQIRSNLETIGLAAFDAIAGGRNSPDVDSLVSSEFIKEINPVAGESYSALTLSIETTTLTVSTPGGQEVSWDRPASAYLPALRRVAEKQLAVEHNLMRIDQIAQEYLETRPDDSSVSMETLVNAKLLDDVQPVAGEDYAKELPSVDRNQVHYTISNARFGTVTWNRPVPEAQRRAVLARLQVLEQAASLYFAQNPKAELVVGGEILPPLPTLKNPEEQALQKLIPDLSAQVLRRDFTGVKYILDSGVELAVPRSETPPAPSAKPAKKK